ncbi:MAG: TonB-dependent receptor plug domain-containing protein, partial [Halomonas sp.]|nr:TonB-dependent receptor plug domain-containing protein [Halomonas sp.]
MTDRKNRPGASWTRWQRTATALVCCTPLVAVPMSGNAQEAGSNAPAAGEGNDGEQEAYRLSPIIVNAQALADDNANTIVAQELWVGGKVATSILDTPASVSVITEKEIELRDANTTEEVLQYTPGVVTEYYATDDRNDYFKIRGFQATTYRDG